MFTKILIANRGEIACRIAATARRMGILTVAVHSEADADARHVALCDEAVCIGASTASASYLHIGTILEAAKNTGAQAIHPGYGFLSENADFARACEDAGIVFIGPPSTAIHAMGSKSAAKTIMEQVGVPLVPGYHGDNQDPLFLHEQADKTGYPVLLKPSAGGGGKGMRIIEASTHFMDALAACRREAASSFGDDHILIEKYLTKPRHIEIQVFADRYGECVTLFERDCSVQRRHQKVLEEAPAPGMTWQRRKAMGDAAVAAAMAVGYVGAGTVEFIVSQDVTFYFMEMNTRLQVEHPVTEMITGTDLVEWQLRIAFGEKLPMTQAELQISGHAIEARIYAENPANDFLPSIGTLHHLRTPPAVAFQCRQDHGNDFPAAVRIDSGVRQGDVISPFYDPMIAKLIVWGPTREHALARMQHALSDYQIVGVANNVAFLKRLITSPSFALAELDTGLIERHHDTLFPETKAVAPELLALACASLLLSEQDGAAIAGDPWSTTSGWRLNSVMVRSIAFADDRHEHILKVTYHRHGWTIAFDHATLKMQIIENAANDIVIRLDGNTVRGTVVREGNALHVFAARTHAVVHYMDPMTQIREAEPESGRLTAPMPGKIVAIHVKKGDVVTMGMLLLVMEAMKMEHIIHAPGAGIIDEIVYEIGDQVMDGARLLSLKAQE